MILLIANHLAQNLRRYYDSEYEKLEELKPQKTPKELYEDLTASKKGGPGNLIPAEGLLKGAGFDYMKKEGQDIYLGGSYPIFRQAVLKDYEVWKCIEAIMEAYQTRKIPHPGVNEAKKALVSHYQSLAGKAPKKDQIMAILKNHK